MSLAFPVNLSTQVYVLLTWIVSWDDGLSPAWNQSINYIYWFILNTTGKIKLNSVIVEIFIQVIGLSPQLAHLVSVYLINLDL